MPDPTFAPVVVGTDGSPPADRAVTWAAEEAMRHRRPLRIVHVIERWVHDIPLFPPPGMRESLSERGLRLLADAKALARERGPAEVTTELAQDSTAHALCDLSRQAYELVLGHRGLGGFTSLLLGSTGLRVAGCAAGPVVIVRGDGGRVNGEVVVGLDLPDDPSAALEYAFDAANVRSARLRVLHAWQLSAPLIAAEYPFDLTEIEQDNCWNVAQALAPWRKRHPDVEIVEDVVRDHPVSALVDASGRADLVVVGARGHIGLGSIRLGSVGHGIIHHSHCPVAVVRPRD
ncbi:universal stress protein [Actinomadura alba]|uniref:Universal stress protein n=1 Tax=Actinomadura alba TaxID=406431 RepID=A0ABR7LY37_9ACTN|nr:universal stress protein [Actinomadura alba]MBC6469763.1 universal stress protein [Actinomadura alba]